MNRNSELKNFVAYAEFWRRVLAYIIDMFPITLLTTLVLYFFFDFGKAFNWAETRFQIREDFMATKSIIRYLSLLVWIIYSTVMDYSKFQGTFGKYVMKIKVVNLNHERLSFKESLIRNTFKIVSYIPAGLGFIWAIFSKKKQGWHDLIAKTVVIKNKS